MTFRSYVFLTYRRILFFNCDLSTLLYRVFCNSKRSKKNYREKMSNIPPNNGHVNQPGAYPPNYAPNQPGTFSSQYGAPAPGQHQQQPLDPRKQEMQEFIVGVFT